MIRILLFVSTLAVSLGGIARADHLPERSFPVTRQMYQRQVEFWNDRADLARLYDLAVTFEGGWRFNDQNALLRIDDRVLRFFDDEIAEEQREAQRDLRERTWYYGPNRPRYGAPTPGYPQRYELQRVAGYDRELDELATMRRDFARLRGHIDPQSLQLKWQIMDRLIRLETLEVQRDGRWLQRQGWRDPQPNL